MKTKQLNLYSILFIAAMFCSQKTWAQLQLVPILKSGEQAKSEWLMISNIACITDTLNIADTLEIPIWEDFSTYEGVPDTSLWRNSCSVYINSHMGISPPTLGVATFDGIDLLGNLYSQNYLENGPADSLVSKPINLGGIEGSSKDSVYLSFFWQLQGNGEKPDAEDSIRLQFKNTDGEWVTQWSQASEEGMDTDVFTQELIQVKEEFLYKGFQFRFESFGRLSGPFDSWNIDYVFLNKDRDENDIFSLDWALASKPSSIFGEYTAVPIKQFKAKPDEFISNFSVDIYNLSDTIQTIKFSAFIKEKLNNEVLETLNDGTAINDLLESFERREIVTDAWSYESLDLSKDSVYIDACFYLTPGDTFLVDGDGLHSEKVNYKMNNTATTTYTLHDYYAYDDGTAEFGAGVNQNGGKIAYQFVVEEPDYINSIDIYFPKIATSQGNTPIYLYVWDSLSQVDSVFLHRQSAVTQYPGSLNSLINFNLERPVLVTDTFYIGFEQAVDDFVAVGLDKNTDSGDHIFFNVDGAWQQNETLKGSLMLRPKFATPDPNSIGEERAESKIRVFPNPAQDICFIEGAFDDLKVYDLWGSSLPVKIEQQSHKRKRLDLKHFENGFYLFYFTQKNRVHVQKIMINK